MKKIFSNSIIYIVSVLFNKGLSFALLPILTHYLSKEDYGILSLIMAIATISSIYVGFSPSTFIITRFSRYGKVKIAEYMSQVFIIIGLSYFVVLFTLLVSENILLPSSLENKNFILVTISFYALGSVLFNLIDTIFQTENNALKFAILQTIQSIGAVGLTLLSVVVLHANWQGKFYSELLILGGIAIYVFFYIKNNNYITISFDLKKIKEVFFFLFPLSFNVLGLYILGTLDRIFISNIVSLEAAGIYAVAISMAFMVNIVNDSILKAIRPYFNKYLEENTNDSKAKAIKITYLYSFICIFVLAVFLLLLPDIFHLMIDSKFNAALIYIPFLAIALSFEGLRKIISLFYIYYGKVKLLALFTVSAAIFNTILNYFLISSHGINGAVESIVVTFMILYFSMLLYIKNIIYFKGKNGE